MSVSSATSASESGLKVPVLLARLAPEATAATKAKYATCLLQLRDEVSRRAKARQVILQEVLQVKRQTLSFFWKTRIFALCTDGSLRRYDGEHLRHSAAITASTVVQKVGAAEFTVAVPQPELRYHIRAASSEQRDEWVLALTNAVSAAAAKANYATCPLQLRDEISGCAVGSHMDGESPHRRTTGPSLHVLPFGC